MIGDRAIKLVIMAANFPSRSETFVTQHVTGMIDRGFKVSVIANGEDPSAWDNLGEHKELLRNNVFNYRVPKSKHLRVLGLLKMMQANLKKGRFQWFKSWNFFKYGQSSLNLTLPYLYNSALNSGSIDILHCHFGPVGLLGVSLKKLGLVKKLIVTFHGYDLSQFVKSFHNGNPYIELFSEADLILPVSEHWKNQLLALGAPVNKIHVSRVGIDIEKFSYIKPKIIDGCLRILTTARFTEKKGLEYAVAAIAKVKRQQPSVKLRYDIIGDGPLFTVIQRLINEYGLLNCVHLHGVQSNQNVRKLLYESDLFILPSVTASNGDQEGIPVALMEAMACGIPVLSTIHSGIPELIQDGKSGYLVPERDVDALAERIISLIENQSRRVKFSEHGRMKIENEYDLQKNHAWLTYKYYYLLGRNINNP